MLWPDRDPLGRQIRLGQAGSLLEVVGVVRQDLDRELLERAPGTRRYLIAGFASDVFLPFELGGQGQQTMLLLVRHDGRPAVATASLTAAAQAIDPDLPVQTRSLREVFEYWLKPFLLFARLGSVLGILALLLAGNRIAWGDRVLGFAAHL